MSEPQCILAIEQGTTSTRAIAFDATARAVAIARRPLTHHHGDADRSSTIPRKSGATPSPRPRSPGFPIMCPAPAPAFTGRRGTWILRSLPEETNHERRTEYPQP